MSKNILTIKKSKLDIAISSIQNAYNKKETYNLSSCLLLETDGDILYIKATNNEAISMKIKVMPDSIEGNIRCAVKGEDLTDCVKSLEDLDVIIEYDDKKDILHIKQKNYNWKSPVRRIRDENKDYSNLRNDKELEEEYDNTEEFPFIDDYKKTQGYKKIDIDNNLLIETFKNISHCCEDRNESRLYSTGILLEIQNKILNMVATDSARLAYIQRDYPNDNVDFSCIISKKGITEFIKLFNANFDFYIKEIDLEKANEEDEYEEIVANIESVCFVNENMELYIKTINIKFPDYKHVANKKLEASPIFFQKDKMLKAMQRVNNNCSVSKITFHKDKIVIESINGKNNSEVKDTIDDIELDVKESLEILMTNKYFIECLANAKCEEIEMYVEDQYSPIHFNLQDFKEIISVLRNQN